MSEKSKNLESKLAESDDFSSLETLAGQYDEYFRGGVLYFVNASKKPTPYEADSQFLDSAGKPKKQTNFKVEVLDLENCEFKQIGTYGGIYKEMIKQKRKYAELGIALPKFKNIELLPFVRKLVAKTK